MNRLLFPGSGLLILKNGWIFNFSGDEKNYSSHFVLIKNQTFYQNCLVTS